MASSRRRPKSVASQLLDLSQTVPQVVAHRTARMALAKPMMSRRDQQEFTGMVMEKQQAAVESMQSMWMSAALTWQRMAIGAMLGQRHSTSPQQLAKAAQSMMSAGLKPYQQKASRNAKRLSKTPLL